MTKITIQVGEPLKTVEKRVILATLAEVGRKDIAAKMLGISLKTLYTRLAVYGSV